MLRELFGMSQSVNAANWTWKCSGLRSRTRSCSSPDACAALLFPQMSVQLPQRPLPAGRAELLHGPGPRRRGGRSRLNSSSVGGVGGASRFIAGFANGWKESGRVEERISQPVLTHWQQQGERTSSGSFMFLAAIRGNASLSPSGIYSIFAL